MEVTPRSRWQIRLENTVFRLLTIAVVILVAWLSTRYNYQSDWTANSRNTLSPASVAVVQAMAERIHITAYARDSELVPIRRHISELVAKYQRHNAAIELEFVNPDEQPERVRELGVINGELVIEYQGRTERVRNVDEQNLSNALQRLQRSGERSIVFVSGHGERSPAGKANHDLGQFGAALQSKGLKVSTVNLAETLQVPPDAAVLVIAGPQIDLLPGELTLIKGYIDGGGNLLWLSDPNDPAGLAPLADTLGVKFTGGTIVDATAQLLGIDHPAVVVITAYPRHAITTDFANVTLFPFSRALTVSAPQGWEAQPLLVTAARSWAETGELSGDISFDEGADTLGPLQIGWVMTRALQQNEQPEQSDSEQRVVVIGDGDFVSNAYLGNAGNLDLGLSVLNWLSSDDSFVSIPARVISDRNLELSETTAIAIGALFLVGLPLAFLVAGITIWLRRRRR